MKRALILALWISVAVAAAILRFDQLAKRPFHADEATGARITARHLESGTTQFDPTHFHGPLLADLAIPLCRLRGENCWRELTKATLRTLPAIAGTLVVLLPLLWRRRHGDGPMLLAAAFLATSPLLVYYSRMFIHESLLVLFGLLAMMALTRKPRWGIPGLLLGLMFATRETFAISVIAWAAAGLLVAWHNRAFITREMLATTWRDYRIPAAISLAVAALTALVFYTDGFRNAQGAIDAVRTYFVYQTGEGHDKPFLYYLQLLALPKKSGGVWWFETPLLAFAIFAYLATWFPARKPVPFKSTIRFLTYAAAGHFLIYSLIAYKTPWLACLPWAHVCLLAGFAVAGFRNHTLPVKSMLALFAGATLVSQFYQARLATGRYAADERNPYAYVPTRADIEKLECWLADLRRVLPPGSLEPISVIGVQYWPLPWSLRTFENIGYWPEPPSNLTYMPLVFAMPDVTATVMQQLGTSHIGLPRGLRTGVPVYVFVRNDLWKHWMESDR